MVIVVVDHLWLVEGTREEQRPVGYVISRRHDHLELAWSLGRRQLMIECMKEGEGVGGSRP